MAKEKRQAETSFIYDRLWEQKLTQIYHLLVPDHNTKAFSDNDLFAEPLEATANENRSDLYESVFGPTKGK
jgi:hypothetical protein